MATLPPTAAQLVRGATPERDRDADRRYDEARADDFAKRVRSTARWQKVRKLAIARDRGLCLDCRDVGRFVAAREVDHVIAVRDDPSLAFVLANLRSLCVPCHRRKEAAARGA